VHRGAKLSLGRICQTRNGECVVCPYHGWEYNSSAKCVLVPAHPEQAPPTRARVDQVAVCEKYGLVCVCLGGPCGDVPSFPEGDQPGFRLIPAGPYQFHAQGPRIIENLLDVAHLPTAHAGMLGDPLHAPCGFWRVC
jgi:phenylpropionate dioxygenase-like ring-hydroxylating dioxygenase large terminal subunit